MLQFYIKFYLLKAKIQINKLGFLKTNGSDNYIKKWERLEKLCVYFNNELDFIETGTYYGLTVDQFKYKVKNLYSIELDNGLYNFNSFRFKKYLNIHLILGNSAVELPKLLAKQNLNPNCIFWLDGHYSSKETAIADKVSPILDELKSIFLLFKRDSNHWIILIDDLRLFDGIEYPLVTEVQKIANDFNFNITFDSDCIVLNSK